MNDGLTSGIYQLQIRLREVDEVPVRTVQYADIRYATNGIEMIGQPTALAVDWRSGRRRYEQQFASAAPRMWATC